MSIRWKAFRVRVYTWWASRVSIAAKYRLLAVEQQSLEDRAASDAYELEQTAVAMKEARQQIEMLQGKLDVLTVQLELSSTVIKTYQSVEETRIAISTADRIRAQAGPLEEQIL